MTSNPYFCEAATSIYLLWHNQKSIFQFKHHHFLCQQHTIMQTAINLLLISLRRRNQIITFKVVRVDADLLSCRCVLLPPPLGKFPNFVKPGRRAVRLCRMIRQFSSLPLVKRSLSPSFSHSLHIQHDQPILSLSPSPHSFVVQAMRSQLGLSF